MKNFLIGFMILLAGFATNTIINGPTAAASEQSPFENSIIVCAENGAPLAKISSIQTNPGERTNVVMPVPQVGAIIDISGDKALKVSNVEYVYGTASIYCIKVYVEPIQ